jgi:hypothetical protein
MINYQIDLISSSRSYRIDQLSERPDSLPSSRSRRGDYIPNTFNLDRLIDYIINLFYSDSSRPSSIAETLGEIRRRSDLSRSRAP